MNFFQCNVPEKILEEITVSNNRFFRDRQLFDSTSVSFIREVLSLNATEPISSQPMVLKLATRFALDVLARSVSGAADACTILAQLRVEASVDVDIAKWFLREFGSRILVLSDFLLNCRDKNTREAFGSVLSVCLETVSAHETPPIPANTPPLPPYSSPIQHEADEEGIPSSSSGEIPRTLCQEVVFSLMRLVDTASRHWVRFHQLFAVLLRWAESGPYARQYLVRLSAVARLGHLTLGRDSQLPGYPKHTTIMGNRIVQPDLHTVYRVMGTVVRGCFGENGIRPPTSLPGPLWALTDLDLIIVNCELFYERALMNGGDVSGVVDILVHRYGDGPGLMVALLLSRVAGHMNTCRTCNLSTRSLLMALSRRMPTKSSPTSTYSMALSRSPTLYRYGPQPLLGIALTPLGLGAAHHGADELRVWRVVPDSRLFGWSCRLHCQFDRVHAAQHGRVRTSGGVHGRPPAPMGMDARMDATYDAVDGTSVSGSVLIAFRHRCIRVAIVPSFRQWRIAVAWWRRSAALGVIVTLPGHH